MGCCASSRRCATPDIRVLFITHNIHHVFEVADRIVVMRRGEIVAEQTVADTDLLTVESIITGADVARLMREGKRRRRE